MRNHKKAGKSIAMRYRNGMSTVVILQFTIHVSRLTMPAFANTLNYEAPPMMPCC